MLHHHARKLGPRKAANDAGRLVCVSLFASFALGQSVPHPQIPQALRVQEDNIREAIFRYRIGTNKSTGSIFLTIDGIDPSNHFMARFANSNLHVKKASGSYFKKDPFPGYLRDRSTDERAVEYSVGPIHWITPTRVEVPGGKYCGGLCADAGLYHVTKKGDPWTVDKYDLQMIS